MKAAFLTALTGVSAYHNDVYGHYTQVVKHSSVQAIPCDDNADGACWLPWSGWSVCEGVCGQSLQTAVRRCRGGIADITDGCGGGEIKRKECTNNAARSALGNTVCPYWTAWSTWSGCTAQCQNDYCAPPTDGSGTRTRTRTCADPTAAKTYRGDSSRCLALNRGEASETEACFGSCPVIREPASLYTATAWSTCTKLDNTCGEGTQSMTETHVCANYPLTWVPEADWTRVHHRRCDVADCCIGPWSEWRSTEQLCLGTTLERTRIVENLHGGCTTNIQKVETKFVPWNDESPCTFDDPRHETGAWGACVAQPYKGSDLITTCDVNGIQQRQCKHQCYDLNEKYRSSFFSPVETRKCGPEAVASQIDMQCQPTILDQYYVQGHPLREVILGSGPYYCEPAVCTQSVGCHMVKLYGQTTQYVELSRQIVGCPADKQCPQHKVHQPASCNCHDEHTVGFNPCGDDPIHICPEHEISSCSLESWTATTETQMAINSEQTCLCKNKYFEFQREICHETAEIHQYNSQYPVCDTHIKSQQRSCTHEKCSETCYTPKTLGACSTTRSIDGVCQREVKQQDVCSGQWQSWMEVCTCSCYWEDWTLVGSCEDISGYTCPSEQKVFSSTYQRRQICAGEIKNVETRSEPCPTVPCPELPAWGAWSLCSGESADLHCGGFRESKAMLTCQDTQCVQQAKHLDVLHIHEFNGIWYRIKTDVHDTRYHSNLCYEEHIESNFMRHSTWAHSNTVCEVSQSRLGGVGVKFFAKHIQEQRIENLCSKNVTVATKHHLSEINVCQPTTDNLDKDESGKVKCTYSQDRCSASISMSCQTQSVCGSRIPPTTMVIQGSDNPELVYHHCPVQSGDILVGTTQCTQNNPDDRCNGIKTFTYESVCRNPISGQKAIRERVEACFLSYYQPGSWLPVGNPTALVQRTLIDDQNQHVSVQCDPCGGTIERVDQKCNMGQLTNFKYGEATCPQPDHYWGEWRDEGACQPDCGEAIPFGDCYQVRTLVIAPEAQHCISETVQRRTRARPPCTTAMRCCDPRFGDNDAETFRECGTTHNGEVIPSEFVWCQHAQDASATCGYGRNHKLEKQCLFNEIENRFFLPGEKLFKPVEVVRSFADNMHCKLRDQVVTSKIPSRPCECNPEIYQQIDTECTCVSQNGVAGRFPFNQVPSDCPTAVNQVCPPVPQAQIIEDHVNQVGKCTGGNKCGTYTTTRRCLGGVFSYTPCRCGKCCVVDERPNVSIEGDVETTLHACPQPPNYWRAVAVDNSNKCCDCKTRQCLFDGCTGQQLNQCQDTPIACEHKQDSDYHISDCIYNAADMCLEKPHRVQTVTEHCDLETCMAHPVPIQTRHVVDLATYNYQNYHSCDVHQYTHQAHETKCDYTDPCKPFKVITTEKHCAANGFNSLIEVVSKQNVGCPVDETTYWTNWSQCSVKCGHGIQTRQLIQKCSGAVIDTEEAPCGCGLRKVEIYESEKICNKCGPEVQTYMRTYQCKVLAHPITQFLDQYIDSCAECYECDADRTELVEFPCPLKTSTECTACPAQNSFDCHCYDMPDQHCKEIDECGRVVRNLPAQQCPTTICSPIPLPAAPVYGPCQAMYNNNVCTGVRTKSVTDSCGREVVTTEACAPQEEYIEGQWSGCVVDCKNPQAYETRTVKKVCGSNVENIFERRECRMQYDTCSYWGDWSDWGPCSTSCRDTESGIVGTQVRQRFCHGGDPGEPGCEADLEGNLSTQTKECDSEDDTRACCDMQWSGWSVGCCTRNGVSTQRKIKINMCGKHPEMQEKYSDVCPDTRWMEQDCSELNGQYRLMHNIAMSQVITIVETVQTSVSNRMVSGYQHNIMEYGIKQTYRFTLVNGVWQADKLVAGQWQPYLDFEEYLDVRTGEYFYRINTHWYVFENGQFFKSSTPASWYLQQSNRITAQPTVTFSQKPVVVQDEAKNLNTFKTGTIVQQAAPVAAAQSFIGETKYSGSYTVQGSTFLYERIGSKIHWYQLVNGFKQTTKVNRKFQDGAFIYNFVDNPVSTWYRYNGQLDTLEKVSWTQMNH